MGTKLRRFAWLLTAALTAACSTSSANGPGGDAGTPDATNPQAQYASASIGPDGGSVSAAGAAALTIPSGALPSSQTITITASPSSPGPTSATVVGTPYVFGPEGLTFSEAVTVTLAFDPSRIPAGRNATGVEIFTAPAGSSSFTALATVVLDATHVAANVTHFSVFVAAVPVDDASTPQTGDDGDAEAMVSADAAEEARDSTSSGSDDAGRDAASASTDAGAVDGVPFSDAALPCNADAAPSSPAPVPWTGPDATTYYHQAGAIPGSLAVDGVNVYWADNATAAIMKAPVDGSQPATPLATGAGMVATDGTYVYWTGYGLWRVSVSGGSPQQLSPSVLDVDSGSLAGVDLSVMGIAVSEAGIYWSEQQAVQADAIALKGLPAGSSVPKELVSLSLFGEDPLAQPIPYPVAVDGSTVFYAAGGFIYSMPSNGSQAPTVLYGGRPNINGLVATGGRLYWTNGAGVATMPESGGCLTVLYAAGFPQGIAVDSTYVYFTDPADGALVRIPRVGGSAVLAAPVGGAGAPPWAVAVDSTRVYWTGMGQPAVPGNFPGIVASVPKQ